MLSDRPRAFLHLTREPDFSQTCGFNRIIKVIMVHDLNPKNLHIYENLHINGLFFCKIQKTLFLGCFWALSLKWDFFSKNLEPVYYPYGTQTSWEVSEKSYELFWRNTFTYWETDILTVINHRTPFCLKTEVEKTKGCVKKPTRLILDTYCVWYLYALDGMSLFTFCGNFHTPKTWYLHAVKGGFIFKLL